MGQAKLRGSKEQRIAQTSVRSTDAPKLGTYISTKSPAGMRFVVEEVLVLDQEDVAVHDGFFLVTMIDEASANDLQAMRDELDSDEWRALVVKYGLIVETSNLT
jgi:hypothetical protein